MHRYIYSAVTLVLALSMSALPAAALAKDDGSTTTGNSGSGRNVRVEASTSDDLTGLGLGDDATNSNRGRDNGDNATNTNEGEDNGDNNRGGGDQNEGEGMHLELESTTTRANSLADLQLKIANRRHELDNDEASTTPDMEDIMKNADAVRIAVLSFLASQNLLNGNGAQIANVAALLNQSLATTTNAELKIHDRGFLTRFFFGGDAAAAAVISAAVADNQTRIDNLTALLNQANVPLNIQTELNAQITVLQNDQVRLQALAVKEQSQWGLFSWRFGS